MIIKAVIHVPTGEFKGKHGNFECGPFEPQRPILSIGPPTVYDPDYDVVVVPRFPEPRTEKWKGGAVVTKTQAEIDAYDAAQLAQQADSESLTPSVLAMLGTIVRGRMGAAAWNALSLAAKKQAVRGEAAVFKNMREFFNTGVV